MRMVGLTWFRGGLDKIDKGYSTVAIDMAVE